VTCPLSARRQAAAEAAPGFKEERLRTGRVEAAFLLEDMGAKYRDMTALRYEGCDYQLPLLQANARYRCAKDRGLGFGFLRVAALERVRVKWQGPGTISWSGVWGMEPASQRR